MSRIKQTPIVFIKKDGTKYSTKISTTTTDEYPKTVFIRTKMTVTPTVKNKTYIKEVTWIRNTFEKFANDYFKTIAKYDNNHYLFSTSVSEKSMKYGKKTHFRYDLFLKPISEQTMEQQRPYLEQISDKLNEKLICLLNDKGFFTI